MVYFPGQRHKYAVSTTGTNLQLQRIGVALVHNSMQWLIGPICVWLLRFKAELLLQGTTYAVFISTAYTTYSIF